LHSILDLDTFEWREEEAGPIKFEYFGTSIQLEDTFLIVGGECYSDCNAGSALNTVYFFDPSAYQWVEMSVTLDRPRSRAAGVLLPNSIADQINC